MAKIKKKEPINENKTSSLNLYKIKSENKIRRGKLISSGPDSLTLSNKDGVKDISLSSILDVKLDLQGMSLKTIKEMEFK